MKEWIKFHGWYWLLLVGVIATVILVAKFGYNRRSIFDDYYSRAIDTVNIGTTPNDGTGDPLRTAFAKINDVIIMLDSLDMELLTNDEMQALKDLEDLTDAVLFHVGDTTVTAAVGKVVFKTSDGTFYGCVRSTPTTRWEAFN